MNRKEKLNFSIFYIKKACWIIAIAIYFLLLGCAKETDQKLWDKLSRAIEQEGNNWQINTLKIVKELIKRNNRDIVETNFIERLTEVALQWVDDNGNWVIDKDRANVMEEVLKQIDSSKILTVLGKKIIEPQTCRKALNLTERIGISGYDVYFLSLLSEQGNQDMAEEFLYSKNKTLSDAGKQWLESRPKAIDNLVFKGASCLNEEAEWIDLENGRRIYDILKTVKGDIVVDALARHVYKPNIRLRALFLGVKLGIPGTEERLNNILMEHGDKQMAEDFLNSGSERLYEGGKRWANENGYYIMTGMGSHRVEWGEF